MGKVREKIELTNYLDEASARAGALDPAAIRRAEVEALVDTGATMLLLPEDVVGRLGARVEGYRKVRYADGRVAEVPWVGGIRMRLRGRETIVTALVAAAGTTALIGQIPLEEMDFVVDPKSRELRPNPASPDAPLLDLLHAA